jgi:hypothetical protein
VTDEELREMAERAPDSLTVSLWRAGQALEGLVMLVCWTWLELLRLDKLLGLRRP